MIWGESSESELSLTPAGGAPLSAALNHLPSATQCISLASGLLSSVSLFPIPPFFLIVSPLLPFVLTSNHHYRSVFLFHLPLTPLFSLSITYLEIWPPPGVLQITIPPQLWQFLLCLSLPVFLTYSHIIMSFSFSESFSCLHSEIAHIFLPCITA